MYLSSFQFCPHGEITKLHLIDLIRDVERENEVGPYSMPVGNTL